MVEHLQRIKYSNNLNYYENPKAQSILVSNPQAHLSFGNE